jgi:alcohol dehydrogenase
MTDRNEHGCYRGTGQQVHWGLGSLIQLEPILAVAEWSRTLIITGASLGDSQALGRVRQVIGSVSTTEHWSGAQPHCPVAALVAAWRVVDGFQPDCIVALGGGSTLDLACALGSNLPQIRRLGAGQRSTARSAVRVPVIAVPTTLSQAEFTDIVGVTEADGTKRVIRDRSLLPRYVLLDGQLLKETPRGLLAATAVKALDSSIAGYVQHTAGLLGPPLLLEAIRRLLTLSPRLGNPSVHGQTLQDLQLAAWMGAFPRFHGPVDPTPPARHAWLGSAARHQLGGKSGAQHGALSAVLLPEVVDFHRADAQLELSDIAAATRHQDIADLVGSLRSLGSSLDLPATLGALGVTRDHVTAAQRAIVEEQPALAPRANDVLDLLLRLI